MKQIILTILLSIIYASSLFAQTVDEPKLTESEIREAQQLAARFYNRLAQTQDVAPLIREFFIRDFVEKFREPFKDEKDAKMFKDAPQKDFLRFYSATINYFFLTLQTSNYLETILGKSSSDKANKIINDELKKVLKRNPRLLKFIDFNYEAVLSIAETKTLNKFRLELTKIERFNQELQKLELKYCKEVQKKNSKEKFIFSPNNFEISLKKDTEGWVNYPKGTRLFGAYSNKVYFALVLVKQSKKLRVAVFFPNLN